MKRRRGIPCLNCGEFLRPDGNDWVSEDHGSRNCDWLLSDLPETDHEYTELERWQAYTTSRPHIAVIDQRDSE